MFKVFKHNCSTHFRAPEMSSPQCPTSAIPRAETTSLPGEILWESSSGKPRDALLCCCSQGTCTGRRWLQTALHFLCASPVPKDKATTQLLSAKQLPSSARANAALPEIPFDRLTCQEGKLQIETQKALFSLVKIFVGSGRGQIPLPSLKGAEGMSQPCSLPLFKTRLPDPREETLT